MQNFPPELLYDIFIILDIFEAKNIPLVCKIFENVSVKAKYVWLGDIKLTYNSNLLPLSFVKQNIQYITSTTCSYIEATRKKSEIERFNTVWQIHGLKKLSVNAFLAGKCSAFKNLEYLEVFSNKQTYGSITINSVCSPEKLETLILTGEQINLRLQFDNYVNLTKLDIHSIANRIAANEIMNLTSLTSLVLVSKDKGKTIFLEYCFGKWFNNFTRLTSLTTDYVIPKDLMVGLSQLTHLGIFGKPMYHRTLLHESINLKSLAISNSNLEIDNTALSKLTKLESLSLWYLPESSVIGSNLKHLSVDGNINVCDIVDYTELGFKYKKVDMSQYYLCHDVHFFDR